MRKATKKDFIQHIKEKQIGDQLNKEIVQTKLENDKSESSPRYPALEVKEKQSKKISSFLKEFPYFCVNCENFARSIIPKTPQKQDRFYYSSYCGNCGSSDSLRLTVKKDIKNYLRTMR